MLGSYIGGPGVSGEVAVGCSVSPVRTQTAASFGLALLAVLGLIVAGTQRHRRR